MTDKPNFHGHEGRECGEHRTVGWYRAWCHDCQEWCYPQSPCARCELPQLRAEVARLRVQTEYRDWPGLEEATCADCGTRTSMDRCYACRIADRG